MKRSLHILLLALALAGAAELQAGPSKQSPFGLGLAVPVNLTPFAFGLGLSGKYWLDTTHAIDGTLFGGSGWISVGADYLWHKYYVFSGDMGKRMPIYYGGGGSVTAWSSGPYSGTALAVQGKLGMNYLFNEPFDLYVETTPGINLTPTTGFGIGISVGGRYYF